jgi:hypothetical protein
MGRVTRKKKGWLGRVFATPTQLGERARKAFDGDSEFSGAPADPPHRAGSPLLDKAEKLRRQFQGGSDFSINIPPAPADPPEVADQTKNMGWEAQEVPPKPKK